MAVGREGFFLIGLCNKLPWCSLHAFQQNLCVHFVYPVILSHIVLFYFTALVI
jgi:hypothetical protein